MTVHKVPASMVEEICEWLVSTGIAGSALYESSKWFYDVEIDREEDDAWFKMCWFEELQDEKNGRTYQSGVLASGRIVIHWCAPGTIVVPWVEIPHPIWPATFANYPFLTAKEARKQITSRVPKKLHGPEHARKRWER
jgi:hypothetical protein